MDVMTMNAALWSLTKGQDVPASAQVVVDCTRQFPVQRTFLTASHVALPSKDDSTSFTGHTEHGDVTIKDATPPGSIPEEKTYGMKKERLGHFRIWRTAHEVYFHHFWASDEMTQAWIDHPPTEYVIRVSKSGTHAVKFGYVEDRRFRLGFLEISFPKVVWTWAQATM